MENLNDLLVDVYNHVAMTACVERDYELLERIERMMEQIDNDE